jgi:hypothetical protein
LNYRVLERERERDVNNCSRKVGETEKSREKRRALYSRGRGRRRKNINFVGSFSGLACTRPTARDR